MRLTTLEGFQQLPDGALDWLGSLVECLANRVYAHAFLAGVCVCLSAGAQATSPAIAKHGGQRVHRIVAEAPRVGVGLVELSQQMSSERIGNLVKLSSSVSIDAEVMPNQGAAKKAKDSPQQSRARGSDPDRKEVEQYWLSYLLLAAAGFAPAALGVFAIHALRYGLNEAWRDLVFSWPIPYWMRFVPKDEQ
jgi:hypothetical protein